MRSGSSGVRFVVCCVGVGLPGQELREGGCFLVGSVLYCTAVDELEKKSGWF